MSDFRRQNEEFIEIYRRSGTCLQSFTCIYTQKLSKSQTQPSTQNKSILRDRKAYPARLVLVTGWLTRSSCNLVPLSFLQICQWSKLGFLLSNSPPTLYSCARRSGVSPGTIEETAITSGGRNWWRRWPRSWRLSCWGDKTDPRRSR